jgi:hypothetical protein
MVQDHLSSASALEASDPSEKTEAKMLTASQTLQQVPDLIDAGDLEQALQILANYQDTSLSTLADLDSIPMDQREEVVSHLLEQKMQDIQQLRVIASMPSLDGNVKADSDMMEQLSVMVLSLREKELGDLSSFFSAHDYDAKAQQAMYDRLKEGADLTAEMTEQLDTVEEQIQDTSTTQVLIDVAPVTEETPQDPRFTDSH